MSEPNTTSIEATRRAAEFLGSETLRYLYLSKLCSSKASRLARIHKERPEGGRPTKSGAPPAPLPQEYARILLITNIRVKNADAYPTMCMIMRELVRKPQNSPLYFHQDSLWVTSETSSNARRTHDVYHRQGVTSKAGKTRHLFSIEYAPTQSENYAQGCAEPTISMIANTVSLPSGKTTCSYVAEIKARSVLAHGRKGLLTHDVYEGMRFNPGMAPFHSLGVSMIS